MEQQMEPYIWHICRPNTVNMVKRLENATEYITSDPLQTNGITFYFQLEFANSPDGNEVAALFLNFMHLPSFIYAFDFEYNIHLKETNIQKYLRSEFKQEYAINDQQLCRHIMNKQDFKRLNSFTFAIQLRIINITYDGMYRRQVRSLVNLNTNIIKLPSISYPWHINSNEEIRALMPGNFIISESFHVYGIKCKLSLTPNAFNTKILISVQFLQHFSRNNFSEIQIRGKCYFVEGNKEESWTANYNNNLIAKGLFIEREYLMRHNRFTFVVEITLVNVFDLDYNRLELPTGPNRLFYECTDDDIIEFAVQPIGTRLRRSNRVRNDRNVLCQYCNDD